MDNYEIADQFSLLSKLMDIHGENSFRSKSYSIAAYHIEKLPFEAAAMDDATLAAQKGIGDATAKKIREILQTGKLDALVKIIQATPPGILEMLAIKGLGPKKIATIWTEMGIESVGELEYACNENRLVAVKGFGAKTQESILQNIAFIRRSAGFHLWSEMEAIASLLLEHLIKEMGTVKFSFTGTLRRQQDTVAFIEIVTTATQDEIHNHFKSITAVQINTEGTIISIQIPEHPLIKFYITPENSFYQTLFKTTGSDAFLEAFNNRFSIPGNIESEEEIFLKNNLSYISPALRATDFYIEKAADNTLPDLIKPSGIKGIIHSHSKWSDGSETIEEMAKAARNKGFEYLVMSDHSQAAYYANGLTPERIAAQHQEIDALNAKLAPFKIFKSIEADILYDGKLDYNEAVLNTFDLVIASVHSNLKMSEEKAMNRVMAAIQNPFTTILGHPTGRLLLSREGYPIDHKAVIDACTIHDVVIEINAHPRRLDLDWSWIEYAVSKGALLSIDPDAHSVAGFGDVYYGVMAAQKGGLTAKNNLSSYSLAEMEIFLEKYRKKRSGH